MKIISTEVSIPGPEGNLQAILDQPEGDIQPQFIAINCHPHSLHGGTMTNKVTHTISRSIAGLGIISLRFNFRGVGQSEGSYDEGRGEKLDLIAVARWMKAKYPQSLLILTGFSFGSFVSAWAAESIEPIVLISVAPPVARFSFEGFSRPEAAWVVIMGDEDELVEYSDVTQWVKSFTLPPSLITMAGASHFFHGRLVELRDNIEQVVLPLLSKPEAK